MLVPAWYGVGTALAPALHDLDTRRELRALYSGSPFFRSLLNNVEMALAKSSMRVAGLYRTLVHHDQGDRIFERLVEECELARGTVLEIAQARELLDRHPPCSASSSCATPTSIPSTHSRWSFCSAGATRIWATASGSNWSGRWPARSRESRPRFATPADSSARLRRRR